MPAPYRPMLLTGVDAPPGGAGWVHEPKLDGWRALVEVRGGRVRVWSRRGREWTARLGELGALGRLDDMVLDGELVVAAPDGRADFELLTAKLNGGDVDLTVSFYAFDLLDVDGTPLVDRPWSARRQLLGDIDLAGRSDGIARTVLSSSDGAAMHAATDSAGAEGTVSKRVDSLYRPGRSRAWVKAKHRRRAVFEVLGWRPTTASRPGGLIVGEDGEPVGVATLALPEAQRRALLELLERYGRRHPTGTLTVPDDCLEAVVAYTCRTPARGHLREATVQEIRPAASPACDGCLVT